MKRVDSHPARIRVKMRDELTPTRSQQPDPLPGRQEEFTAARKHSYGLADKAMGTQRQLSVQKLSSFNGTCLRVGGLNIYRLGSCDFFLAFQFCVCKNKFQRRGA